MTTSELRLKAEKLRKIHPKEIGLRAGEAAELIEELIREREWREWKARLQEFFNESLNRSWGAEIW